MAEADWKTRTCALLENGAGRIAVVIGHGVGSSPGRQIAEVNKDGTPAKKAPYWIKSPGATPHWKAKGRCTMVFRERDKTLEYYFKDFVVNETTAPHNPDNIEFTYVVEYEFLRPKGWFSSERVTGEVRVSAVSGEAARRKVAGSPEQFGIDQKAIGLRVCGARPLG